MNKLTLPLFHHRQARKPPRGQSFLELALVLPILLLILLGLFEVVVFIGRYLDLLDMTREAARFASLRDPFVTAPLNQVDCRPKVVIGGVEVEPPFHFYYATSCIFSPPQGSGCAVESWCNGINTNAALDMTTDDVVISVFTVTNTVVTNTWPQKVMKGNPVPGVNTNDHWALSDHDADEDHNENWRKDCQGNIERDEPYYTRERINEVMQQSDPTYYTRTKGFVAVELYYCYRQVMGLPLLAGTFIPNPARILVYSLMPLPAAAPTATPHAP